MIFQRETKDFLYVDIERAGEPATTGIELVILPRGQRPEDNPTAWTPAEVRGDGIGITIENLEPALYKCWARVTAGLDKPVLIAQDFEVA